MTDSRYQVHDRYVSAGIRFHRQTREGAMTTGAILMVTLLGAVSGHADTAAGLTDFRQGRFAEAFQAWRDAAAGGDPRGALFMGVLSDAGIGVAANPVAALGWYRQAGEAGNATAAFNAGVMYDAGRGTPRNLTAAASWYARAAARNFARAEYNLAMMYDEGSGMPRDRARALALYTRAAVHGIAAARAHLASLGRRFSGAAQPTEDAAMVSFAAAQQLLLTRGAAAAAAAAALFRRAADQNNPLAEYDLGYCYERGLGVTRDDAQAYRLYRRAFRHATDSELRALASAGAKNVETQLSQAQRHQIDP